MSFEDFAKPFCDSSFPRERSHNIIGTGVPAIFSFASKDTSVDTTSDVPS